MSREFRCSSIVMWNGYNTKINKLHPSDNRRVCMLHIKKMPLKWSKQQQRRAPAIAGFHSSQRQWANGRANKISVLIRKPLNIPACALTNTHTHSRARLSIPRKPDRHGAWSELSVASVSFIVCLFFMCLHCCCCC